MSLRILPAGLSAEAALANLALLDSYQSLERARLTYGRITEPLHIIRAHIVKLYARHVSRAH